jgi:hypothetical protein
MKFNRILLAVEHRKIDKLQTLPVRSKDIIIGRNVLSGDDVISGDDVTSGDDFQKPSGTYYNLLELFETV